MPNNKLSARDRAFQFQKNGFYCTDNRTIMCKHCNCQVAWERKDSVEKHLKSAKHVAAEKEGCPDGKLQTSIATCFSSGERKKETAEYLGKRVTETFMKANIPLYKLENDHFKEFLNEFIEGAGDIPCVKTLREKFLPTMKLEREAAVRETVKDKQIVVLCDETTDSRGSCVFVVLFKIIESSEKTVIVVGDVHTLEAANAKNCSRAILDSLSKYNIDFDSVLALVSDSAKYMVKCFDTLKNIMADHVLVVQCWAHKLNLVINELGKYLPELQKAVGKVKSVFLNTRKRKHLFRQFLDENYPGEDIPLFPMPVLTRWSSWYTSVSYLADNLIAVVEFLTSDEIARVSNTGVEYFVGASGDDIQNVKIQAVFVKETCKDSVELIKKLEGSAYPCSNTLVSELRKVEQILQLAATGSFAEKTAETLSACVKAVAKGKVTSTLTTAASHDVTKLLALKRGDPARDFYQLSIFDPPQIVLTTIAPQIAKELQKLFLFSKLSESDLLCGYKELQFSVKQQLSEGKKVDIIALLMAVSVNNSKFAQAALQSVWLPCANVDCERFFSNNKILSDQRHRLKQDNVELLSEIYFDS